MKKEKKEDKADSTKTKEKAVKPAASKDKKNAPLELVLRNLISGQKKSFKNVMNYEFSENGKQLIFSTKQEKKDSLDKTKYGVFLVNTATFIEKQLVDTIGEFKQFVFDENAAKVAKTAYKEGKTLKQVAVELNLVTAEQFDEVVRPEQMISPNVK